MASCRLRASDKLLKPSTAAMGAIARRRVVKVTAVTLIAAFTVGLIPAPLVARAQPARQVARIGLLSDESAVAPSPLATSETLSQALRDLGWVEGQTFILERRYAQGNNALLSRLATELIGLRPRVIVTVGTAATIAAQKATETIPIIFTRVGDPVGFGFVKTLARPGGNLTGVTTIGRDLSGKRLELLKETAPGISRVGVLWDPTFPTSAPEMREVKRAARTLGVELHVKGTQRPEEFEGALLALTRQQVGALIVLPAVLFTEHREQLAALTTKSRLPTMSLRRELVDAGLLVSYGPDFTSMHRRAATYVDKILKGAKPADLPVEQPTKVELVINLKTAKALGITIPQSLLLRADHVIE